MTPLLYVPRGTKGTITPIGTKRQATQLTVLTIEPGPRVHLLSHFLAPPAPIRTRDRQKQRAVIHDPPAQIVSLHYVPRHHLRRIDTHAHHSLIAGRNSPSSQFTQPPPRARRTADPTSG